MTQTENKPKNMIIASFIPKNSLEWFVNYLHEKFKLNKENVFVYEIEGDDIDYLTTFKLSRNLNIDFKKHFNNATIVNIKNECIFSINGLNRLIEEESGCDMGNINHKNHKIDWDNYKNKIILTNKSKLSIKNIKKIDNNVEK